MKTLKRKVSFIDANNNRQKVELEITIRNGYFESSYAMDFYTNYQQGNHRDNLLISINREGYSVHIKPLIFIVLFSF